MNFKLLKIFFIGTILFCGLPGAAKKNVLYKDSLRNVFELSRELSRITSPDLRNDAERQKILLGKILWYANLQDVSVNLIDTLQRKTKIKYAELNRKIKQLVHTVLPINKFFTEKITDQQFNLITKSDSFKNALKDFKGEYQMMQIEYTKSRNALKLFPVNSQTKKKIEINKASLSTLRKTGADTTEIMLSIDSLNKLYDTEYDALSRKRDNASEQLDEKRIEIEKVLIDNFSDLITFLNSINTDAEIEINATQYTTDAQQVIAAAQSQTLQVSYQISAAPLATFKMPSESEMIDALAIYIAKRIKQESVMWFFEQISKNASQYELLQTFFPNTISMLMSNEIYEIPNMGMQWRYALAKDFVRMPQNVLNSKWMTDRFPLINQYKSYINGTCAIAEGLMNKMTYRDIIAAQYMENHKSPAKTTKTDTINKIEFNEIIDFLHAVNTELAFPPDSLHPQVRLVTYEDYRTLTGKEMEVMLSLLDMRYNGLITKFININKDTFSFNNKVKPDDMRLLLGRIEKVATEIEATRKVLIDEIDKSKETTNSNFREISYSTVNVWTSVNNLLLVFNTVNPSDSIFTKAISKSQNALKYTGQLFEVYNLISKKNYAGAVQNMIQMVDSLFYGADTNNFFHLSIQDFEKVTARFGSKKIFQEIIHAAYTGGKYLDDKKEKFNFEYKAGEFSFLKISPFAAIIFDKDRHSVQLVKKLAGFLNDAALAKDSKDLAKAIESYALPPGSYKRKRNSWFSADVTAIAGPYFGFEFVPEKKQRWEKVYGLSVPIGFSFSKTIRRQKFDTTISRDCILNPDKIRIKNRKIVYRTKTTFTALLSIIDIGAVVSYRLQNAGDSVLPQTVKWQQFISPGVHFGYGIPGTPLVLQVGGQYTPLLRRLSAGGGDKEYNAYRAYFGLFYDLPLINMWEKKRFRR